MEINKIKEKVVYNRCKNKDLSENKKVELLSKIIKRQ